MNALRNILAGLVALSLLCGAALAQDKPFPAATPPGLTRIFWVTGVALGATGDVGTISIPSSITAWNPTAVRVTNCSNGTNSFTITVYTGANQTGTQILSAAAASNAGGAGQVTGLSGTQTTAVATANTAIVHVTIANGSALTCDFGVNLVDFTGY